MAVIAMAKITLTRVDDGSDGADGKMLHGTCATVAGTAAKSVTCADAASLYAGLTVLVEFTNANTASAPTLNVNSLGAKSIYISGAAVSSSNLFLWGAGAKIQFTYNGTYWIPIGHPCAYYGTSATAAATAAKTAAISGIVVCRGTTVGIKFTYNNTAASPTLNVSSVGAKAVYTQGVAYAYWAAGAAVQFTFDGTSWRVSSEPVYAPTVTVGNSREKHIHIDGNSIDFNDEDTTMVAIEANEFGGGQISCGSIGSVRFGVYNDGNGGRHEGVNITGNLWSIIGPETALSMSLGRLLYDVWGLRGLRFRTYTVPSRTYDKGATTIANIIDIDPATIISLSGVVYYAPSDNYYPVSMPMMNDQGAYSATSGFNIRIHGESDLQVIVSSQWTQTSLKILAVYYTAETEYPDPGEGVIT